MQTVTSRDLQNGYGQFIESVQDDVVCVTRHGRPLFWAMSDRQLRSKDMSVFIGKIMLLRGQLKKTMEPDATDTFTTQWLSAIDPHINADDLSEEKVMDVVHAHRT